MVTVELPTAVTVPDSGNPPRPGPCRSCGWPVEELDPGAGLLDPGVGLVVAASDSTVPPMIAPATTPAPTRPAPSSTPRRRRGGVAAGWEAEIGGGVHSLGCIATPLRLTVP